MISLVRKFTPGWMLQLYHWSLAVMADHWYGRPSQRLIVVGVTGTSGKSTTLEFLASVLEAAGRTVGMISTIRFKVGAQSWLNRTKMTMVGRFQLQRLLRQMADAGDHFALVETTSQGIAQHRHRGIRYDAAVLTNFYPEHLDAHGGLANYRAAKRALFAHVAKRRPKVIAGHPVPRTLVVNLDLEDAPEFLGFAVEQKYGFTTAKGYDISGVTEVAASLTDGSPATFRIDDEVVALQLPGVHNVSNALAAWCAAAAFGIAPADIRRGLEHVAAIPGRIEFIRADQPFTVIVDYAFEPVAMDRLYAVAKTLPRGRIIQVLGTTGGGRDRDRGAVLGRLAGEFADVVVATDEDPYDDDPRELARRVVAGAQAAGKTLGRDLVLELDRRQAIRYAVRAAKPGDLVLVTGKGCEQAMVVANGKKIPWDDRAVVREELAALNMKQL